MGALLGTSCAAPRPAMTTAALTGGSDIGESLDVQRSVEATAARFVRTWGFTTVGMVSQRFRLTVTTDASRLFIARQAISRQPDVRWLDPTREWFTLIERDSRPKAALAKIFAISAHIDQIDRIDRIDRIDQEELTRALGKRHTFRDVPSDVVRAYLTELIASHARAGTGRDFRAEALTLAESVLVDVLQERGGYAPLEVLRREVKRWSITAEALKRTLAESPLFIRVAQGLYGLIGTPAAPRTLVSSPRWEAAL